MLRVTASLLLAVSLVGAHSTAWAGMFQFPKIILQSNSMVGVSGAFVGDANPVRGIPGDDLPWTAPAKTAVRLTSTGSLFIAVRGLVIEDGPGVPPDQVGTNPDDTFKGLVSCLTEENGMVVEKNVATKPFPADKHGNSLIVDKVTLPNPCLAPIVMVLDGDANAWFSMTGFESD